MKNGALFLQPTLIIYINTCVFYIKNLLEDCHETYKL